MLKVLIKSRLDLLKLAVMVFVAALSFQSNFFKFANDYFFDKFDLGSQSLILGGITADRLSLEKHGAHIGFLSIGENFDYTKNMLDAYPIFEGKVADKDVFFSPYKSQYGIQGPVFSTAYSLFNLKTIDKLQLCNTLSFALVVGLLTLLYFKIYNVRFGLVFFAVMVSSPWIIAFARNLYWMPVLWFLPAVFTALAYRAGLKSHKIVYVVLVGVAVFLKSLAGYEYLSAITLFACSVFVVAPFFNAQNREWRQNLILFGFVFAVCVFGFTCALLLHAGMRGDTIVAGLQNIFEQDVKRRTYGDPSTFDEVFKASLQSSPLDVLRIYINNWNTALAAYLPGGMFKMMIVFSVVGFLYSSISKRALDKQNAVIFVFFFATSASWYFLAKGHSYIHTQLNYVLWYFGFAQALFYICLSYIVMLFKDCHASIRERSPHKLVLMSVLIVGVVAAMVLAKDDERESEFKEELLKLTADKGVSVKMINSLTAKLTLSGDLAFYSENCAQVDLNKAFYLHVYQTGKQGGEGDYENLDFDWKRFDLPSPMWPSKYANSCIAIIKLPNYSIQKLDFGQYSIVNGVIDVAWRESLSLEEREPVTKITAFNLSDANWTNGVSVNRFFVSNNFANRQSLVVDGHLKFAGTGLRKILALEYTENFINITVDGTPLNAGRDGYPNIIQIKP